MKNTINTLCLAVLVPVLIFSAGCGKSRFTEKEGNNTFATANSGELQKEITGFLQTPDDVDFYSFNITSPAVLDINLSGTKGINHSFKIWDSSKQLLKTVDDARKSSPERMCNFSAEPGLYYISVQHGIGDEKKGSTESPYILFVGYRDRQEEEREPNDCRAQATPIIQGQEYTGWFSPGLNRMNTAGPEKYLEEDWFSLEVPGFEENPLLLTADLSGVPGVNSVIRIYNPEGRLVKEQDVNPADQGETVSSLGAAMSGTWYICVSAKGQGCNHKDPYRLYVTLREYDRSMELEPNNTMETANDIQFGAVSGSLDSADDIDFFRYAVSGGDGICRVSAAPDPSSEVTLAVYGERGTKLAEINSSGPGQAAVYPDLFGRDVLNFSVSTKGKPGTYSVSVEPVSGSDAMEKEPNDTKDTACRLTSPEIRGFTSCPGDRDWFFVSTSGRAAVELEISGPENGEIRVSVTDPMGFILKSKTVSGSEPDTLSEMLDGSGYVIVETVKPDTDNSYYIFIKKKK